MKRIAAVGSVVGLFLVAVLLSAPAYAADTDFDATGTWNYQSAGAWTDCSGPPAAGEAGELTILQTGDTFSLKFAQSDTIYNGNILGSRYQYILSMMSGGSFMTQSAVWRLNSASTGAGFFTMLIGDELGYCSLEFDLNLQK